MRLTLWLLGTEVLALDLGPTTAADDACSLDGGTTASTAMTVGEVTTWLGETGMEGEVPEDRRRTGF